MARLRHCLNKTAALGRALLGLAPPAAAGAALFVGVGWSAETEESSVVRSESVLFRADGPTPGRIITMVDPDDRPAGLLIVEAQITEVFSTTEEIDAYIARHPPSVMRTRKVVRLNGATLMPGFVEPHVHLPLLVNFSAAADLSTCLPEPYDFRLYGDDVMTIDGDTVSTCGDFPNFRNEAGQYYNGRGWQASPPDFSVLDWAMTVLNNSKSRIIGGVDGEPAWIVGNGIDPARFGVSTQAIRMTQDFRARPAAYIEKHVKDAGPGESPVFLLDQSGHVAYVNGSAFVAAGVCESWPCGPDDAKKSPGLGKWAVDARGRFTGLLQEEDAYLPFLEATMASVGAGADSPFYFMTKEDGVRATPAVIERIAEKGVTTLVDAGGFSTPMIDYLGAAAYGSRATGYEGALKPAPFRIRTLVSSTLDGQNDPQAAARAAEKLYTGPWAARVTVNGRTLDNKMGVFGVNGVKFWIDGSTQGCSAFLVDAYADAGICAEDGEAVHGSHGANYIVFAEEGDDGRQHPDNDADALAAPIYTADDHEDGVSFYNAIMPFAEKGMQIQVHSNGDKAMIGAARTAQKLIEDCHWNFDDASLPMVLHHATVGGGLARSFGETPVAEHLAAIRASTRLAECDGRKVAEDYDIGLSHTAGHVAYWGGGFISLLDGKTDFTEPAPDSDPDGRAPWLDANRAELGAASGDQGAGGAPRYDYEPFAVSFHSDAPITPVSPLWYVSQMVTRFTWTYPQIGAEDYYELPYPQGELVQTIDVYQALKGVTTIPAMQNGLDRYVGSLEPGKAADLVILDQDPLSVEKEGLPSIVVCGTYLNGKRWKPSSQHGACRQVGDDSQ